MVTKKVYFTQSAFLTLFPYNLALSEMIDHKAVLVEKVIEITDPKDYSKTVAAFVGR